MSKIQDLDKALQYLRSKVPQHGMFSTLDELVQAAPFEQGSPEQWQGYLKPGRVFSREGVNFPLKAEELQYSGLPDYFLGNPGLSSTKEQILNHLRERRPEFNVQLGVPILPAAEYGTPRTFESHVPDEWNTILTGRRTSGSRVSQPIVRSSRFNSLAHEEGVPDSYQESVTLSPNFDEFPSHFTNNDLSWSRTTRHYLNPKTLQSGSGFYFAEGQEPTDQQTLRLIEEIQSDRHQAAAEKLYQPPAGFPMTANELKEENWGELPTGTTEAGRRGYRTPADEEALDRWAEGPTVEFGGLPITDPIRHIRSKPPDTPFKNPEDYAGLELRKQLLNAVKANDNYLGLVRGSDQVARYGGDEARDAGMNYMYDTIYPKALRKLATQYGAKVSDVGVPVKQEKAVFPEMFNFYGVDNPFDFLEAVNDPETPELMSRETHRLLDEYRDRLGLPEGTLSTARSAADNLVNENTGIDMTQESLPSEIMRSHLITLDDSWRHKMRGSEIAKKTFPSMEITPEVADRVRKAGVPLWSLAGLGTAAGLGAYDQQAQANPVEDEAMNQSNGFAKGGDITSALAKLAKMLGRGSEEAAPAVEKSVQMPMLNESMPAAAGSGRNAPRDPRMEGLQSLVTNQPTDSGYYQWAVKKPNGQIHGAPFEFKGSALHVADGLNKQLPGHTVTAIPTDLSPLDRFTPQQRTVDPMQKATAQDIDKMLSDSDPPLGMAEGGSFDPVSFAAQNVRGQSSPGTPGVSGAIKDAFQALQNWITARRTENTADRENVVMQPAENHAEGGTTGVSTDHEVGLGKRFLTRVKEQAYGLDDQGNPALGGRAWTQGQGGTPMGLLDEVTAVPHNLLSLMHTTRSLDPIRRHLPGNAEGQAAEDSFFDRVDPQWSKDAADRLDRLRQSMNRENGVGEAHTFPEHLTDAAASLVSPFPAASEGKAAGLAGRLMEMTVPLRPRTLKNYATDSAVLGGVGTGIDALVQRLQRLHAQSQPQQSQVDPTQFSHDMGVDAEPRNINNNHQMVPLVGEDGTVVMGVDPNTF